MSEETTKIPKPQMRGLLKAQIKRNLMFTALSCLTAGLLMKFLFVEPRRRASAKFYETYDINKEFDRIRRKGLFDSCDPYEEVDDDEEENT